MSAQVFADEYDAPATYYSSATGTGSVLKNRLHNIIDGHTVFSYNALRSILQITDADLNRPGYMLPVYDRVPINVAAINPNGSIPGWDSAATWNREHTWPRSRGVNSSGADNSDLHQLRPSRTRINSDRGSLNFGGAYNSNSGQYGTVSDGGTKWYPGNADAGMIARQQFYMAVRYDGSDSATSNLELSAGNPRGSTLGDLNRMIEWHYAAVPDAFERRRNDIIFDSYQGNRNPFVDRPEFAWSVLVDQNNDSQITLGGGIAASNGGSILDVDLGRVIVGSSVGPSSQVVALNKAGFDGTYFSVEASGSATVDKSGSNNAFRTGQTDTTNLVVGLSQTAAVAGRYTGAVTINNLDVTTQGGFGRGANDADDTINLAYDVLNHSNASFSAVSNLDLLTLDFGTVYGGANVNSLGFDLFNFDNGSNFVAGLDLDSVSGVGDTNVFDTSFDLFSGLMSSESVNYTIDLLPSIAGEYTAGYSFLTSDEDIDGATSGNTLVLIVKVQVVDVLKGDMNLDGTVDAADLPFYVLSLQDLANYESVVGVDPLLPGDLDGDLDLDQEDVRIAARQFVAVDGSVVDRKQNFIDIDQALDVLDDGLLNGSDNNFFGTVLATPKMYEAGDSRGDYAGLGPLEGADGRIDAADIDWIMAVLATMEAEGVDAAAKLLGEGLIGGDGDSQLLKPDLLLALDLVSLNRGQTFDPQAWARSLGLVPEPATCFVMILSVLGIARRRCV